MKKLITLPAGSSWPDLAAMARDFAIPVSQLEGAEYIYAARESVPDEEELTSVEVLCTRGGKFLLNIAYYGYGPYQWEPEELTLEEVDRRLDQDSSDRDNPLRRAFDAYVRKKVAAAQALLDSAKHSVWVVYWCSWTDFDMKSVHDTKDEAIAAIDRLSCMQPGDNWKFAELPFFKKDGA